MVPQLATVMWASPTRHQSNTATGGGGRWPYWRRAEGRKTRPECCGLRMSFPCLTTTTVPALVGRPPAGQTLRSLTDCGLALSRGCRPEERPAAFPATHGLQRSPEPSHPNRRVRGLAPDVGGCIAPLFQSTLRMLNSPSATPLMWQKPARPSRRIPPGGRPDPGRPYRSQLAVQCWLLVAEEWDSV